jgi:hypothetical protein
MDPVRELEKRSTISSAVRLLISDGMDPVREVE